jgi:hypothetical protein
LRSSFFLFVSFSFLVFDFTFHAWFDRKGKEEKEKEKEAYAQKKNRY